MLEIESEEEEEIPQQQHYTEELKQEAVKLVWEVGLGIWFEYCRGCTSVEYSIDDPEELGLSLQRIPKLG